MQVKGPLIEEQSHSIQFSYYFRFLPTTGPRNYNVCDRTLDVTRNHSVEWLLFCGIYFQLYRSVMTLVIIHRCPKGVYSWAADARQCSLA